MPDRAPGRLTPIDGRYVWRYIVTSRKPTTGCVGFICLLGALIMWKFQLDDSSPWTYLVVVQLVIVGTLIILLGHDWFLRV
jgi:hypothetical protein